VAFFSWALYFLFWTPGGVHWLLRKAPRYSPLKIQVDKVTGRVPLDLTSLRALAAGLEFVGGPMLMVGLFTRPVAFLLSGEMAFAYFLNHWPERFWGSFVEPNQEAAILNSFLFLFLWGAGPGAWSLDGAWRPAARVQPAVRVQPAG